MSAGEREREWNIWGVETWAIEKIPRDKKHSA